MSIHTEMLKFSTTLILTTEQQIFHPNIVDQIDLYVIAVIKNGYLFLMMKTCRLCWSFSTTILPWKNAFPTWKYQLIPRLFHRIQEFIPAPILQTSVSFKVVIYSLTKKNPNIYQSLTIFWNLIVYNKFNKIVSPHFWVLHKSDRNWYLMINQKYFQIDS